MMINITKLTHVVLVSRHLYSDILTVWILKKDYFEFSAVDPIRPLAVNSKISQFKEGDQRNLQFVLPV